MNIDEFVSFEEMQDAPAGEAGFAHLLVLAQRRLAAHTRDISTEHEEGWREIEDARHSFMNLVLGLAQTYGVEPFKSMALPSLRAFDHEQHHAFKRQVEYYLIQVMAGDAIAAKSDAVDISADAKKALRKHISGLKLAIDKAEIHATKRAALHKKLAELEAQLERDRLNVWAYTRVIVDVMTIASGAITIADSDTFKKFLAGSLWTVAEAKAVEDAVRRLPADPPKPLMIDRRPPQRPRPEDYVSNLDDEIPF